MTNSEIIQKVAEHVKAEFENDNSGHDWDHMQRVWNNAKVIGKKEGADMFVVQLGALLHDIGDWKFHDDPQAGSKKTKELLSKFNVNPEAIEKVAFIVDNVSFKGGIENKMKGLEGFVVQDADRLDAIGAIGIARVFTGAAFFKESYYDPAIKVKKYKSAEEYKQAIKTEKRTTINHFYEKLLKLKDLMNTKTGKEMAEERHKYMEQFVERFIKEWEGKA